MSYFDFFCENIERNTYENSEQNILGTCYSMCPQLEVDLRVREKMVHVLEVVGSEKKLVKSYSRSAADSNIAVPRILRPYSVLKDTLKYLLFEVLLRREVSTLVIYNFVDDRLRAIRQDMIIQRLPPNQCVTLLDPMIRFYVYYGYKLQGLHGDFNAVLNKKCLLECTKWFLNCCDNNKQTCSEAVDDLSFFMSKLDLEKGNTCVDRPLMESIYILCNLTDIHPLVRYLSLPKELKRHYTLKLAYEISLANLKGNYITVTRLINNLCPLTYYALCLHLPEIQRHALRVMSVAYSSKQLTVPGDVIQNWLHLGSKNEVLTLCQHYGLTTQGDTVKFNRADFKTDVALHTAHKNLLYEEKLSLKEIFTYTTNAWMEN